MDAIVDHLIRGYELHECIGAGKFGTVYRASQPVVGREVAIKVIRPEYANQPEFIRHFEVEAQLVARLEHPHIVPLYDYWRDPDGAYLVMRWLPGNLRSALTQGVWSVEAAARLLDQVTAALSVTHRNHIVHQDIKPDNLLLDEDHNVYLADFRIVLNLSARGSNREEIALGSLAYLAPEQIRNELITPQTDIYSLGLVIYELLTGEKPFFEAATRTALISKHLNDPLPALNTRRADLPAALDAVIQIATAKDPTHRYKDALRLAAAFQAAVPPIAQSTQPLIDPLTRRELEVLELILSGLSVPEIAEKLFLSLTTVRWYVRQIYSKLDVHNRSQAIERVSQLDLFPARVSSPASNTPLIIDSQKSASSGENLENPYKGLRAFQEADSADFFGRNAQVKQLVSRLNEGSKGSRFLALVGPSGSGKSSLVKAGLLPAMRAGAVSGSDRWFIGEMLPGTHPFEELEAALLRVAINRPEGLLSQIREDERGLSRVLKQILPSEPETELLLVIDQFEELFTLVEDEPTRTRFIDSLLAAISDERSRLRVMVTLRADFYDRPLLYPKLAEVIEQHTQIVVPLTKSGLEEAIAGPATRVGIKLEPGLVSAVMNDVGDYPGMLPLLQYALTELFEHREQQTLTWSAYHASGGVRSALIRRADELYNSLNSEAQALARQIFLRLVTLGEGSEDTRRRVLQAELASIMEPEDYIEEVLQAFGSYRLLTFDRDPLTHTPTVEIAHEALIQEWTRLRDWLRDSREDLRMQRRLTTAAAEWSDAGCEASFLLSGSRLDQFVDWKVATTLRLTEQEQAYLEASRAEQTRRRAAEAQRQKEEQTLQRRAANRLRYLVGTLTVFLVVAIALSLFALVSRAEAVTQQRLASMNATRSDALRLAADANSVLSGGSAELATLLGIRSLETAYSPEGDAVLQQALRQNYARQLFTGHTDRVWAVAYSPDGRYVLTGSFDKTARLWDAQTGKEVQQFIGHTDDVQAVAFSPDGRYVLTGSADKTARLWDAQTGKEVQRFIGHTDVVFAVAFSPDGAYIATSGADTTTRLWDASTGKEIRQFVGHTANVRSLAFSEDGHDLLTASEDHSARLWDVESGTEIRRFTTPDSIFAAALSSDSHYVLLGAGKTASLWDAQTGSEQRTFIGHTDFIFCVAFSPDGSYVATGSVDATARVWDLQSGQQIRLYAGHVGTVYGVAFSPDSKSLLTGSKDMTARLWDVQQTAPLGLFVGHTSAVYAVAYSPDGHYVLTGSSDKTARLWDVATDQEVRQFVGHTDVVSSVAFSPDGKSILTGSYDKTVRLWDVQTGQEIRQFVGHTGAVNSVAFSTDGTRILSGSDDKTARLWDTQTGKEILQWVDPDDRVMQAVFSPDEHTILTGDGAKTARLWDVQSGQQIRQFNGHTDGIYSVAFSPNGKYVLTGSFDKTARLWDVQTGQEIREFKGHHEWIWGVAFSPDGKSILTGSYDKTARLWDVQTGQELRRFAGYTGAIAAVAFSPDGKSVLLGSYDNTAQRSDIDYHGLIQAACARVLRDFTDDERLQFEISDTQPTCVSGSSVTGMG